MLKAHDIFLKVSESVDSLNWYWFIAFNTESESENIINLLFASQVLMIKGEVYKLACSAKEGYLKTKIDWL